GDLPGYARAHEYHIYTSQHGAIEAVEGGKLHLFHEVEPYRVAVPFLCQGYRCEAGGDGHFTAILARVHTHHGQRAEWCIRRFTARDKEALQNARRRTRDGELLEGAAQVAFRVAELQQPRDHHIHGGAGHDAQLPLSRNGLGKGPVGDAYTHASLEY